ncbi:unnamed protein product, partial [Ectocarpus sp. 12 AP-2014]
SDTPFTIAGRDFRSRLLVGTGKYKDFTETGAAIAQSGAEIVTFAVRRTNLGQDAGAPNLLDVISPERYTLLPNTAGCYNAKDAVRTCRLARELLDGHNLVKLEVLGDDHTLYPNVVETLKAAETLLADGFDVMVYTSDDPIVARELEAMGCCAIMPLGSLIGSGHGIQNPHNVRLIVEQSSVPVLVDAGIGTASDAAMAMELGCDGVLLNTAIAHARDPLRMANAMKLAVEAGPGPESQDAPLHRRGIKSYVIRAGRMTQAQNRGLEDIWPRFGLTIAEGRQDLDALFGRQAPRVVEIGFGMGNSLIEQAETHPDTDFIGIEVHAPGVGKLLDEVDKRGLTNLRVYREDALAVLEQCLPEGSLTTLQLFFPDPWPKKKHHKRRIVQPAFVEL